MKSASFSFLGDLDSLSLSYGFIVILSDGSFLFDRISIPSAPRSTSCGGAVSSSMVCSADEVSGLSSLGIQ